MTNKVLGGIGVLLIVAAVVGVVATVAHHKQGSGGGKNGGLRSTSKSIASLCASTVYPETCVKTLSHAGDDASNSDIMHAAFNATMSSVAAAVVKFNDVMKDYNDPYNKMVIEDCQYLLGRAASDLRFSLSRFANASSVDDVKTYLSAVVSYPEACLEGFDTDPNIKSKMEKLIQDSRELVANILDIFTVFSEVIGELPFQLPGNITAANNGGRKLLEEGEGFPEWVSAGDRRLLAAGRPAARPNAVVAKDGSGNYRTIGDALNNIPKGFAGRWVIYVKAGKYVEHLLVTSPNVFMYGDGARRTIVTNSQNRIDGVPTFRTATLGVEAPGFIGKDMGFANTAGPAKHQAVAFRSNQDNTVMYRCRFDGYQDMLYAQSKRQFYRNCVISGTVDFIFGMSTVVIQNSLIIVRRGMASQQNTVTADGSSQAKQNSGIVIHNCRIVPEGLLFPDRFKIASYLGRPWKKYSKTVVMESVIGDLIRPEGWLHWDDSNQWLSTLFYAEYANTGPGANTARRVKWPGFHVLGRNAAMAYTVNNFLHPANFIAVTGAPYIGFLRN